MTKKTKKVEETELKKGQKTEKAAAVKAEQQNAKQKADIKAAEQKADKKEAKKPGIETTLGLTLMLLGSVRNDNGVRVPGALYGKYDAAGKNQTEKTKHMVRLAGRPLSDAEVAEYTALAGDAQAQKEYILKTVYPMHADDKAFGNNVGQMNGRPVDYVIIQKITAENALAPGKTELTEEQKKFIGQYELKAGVKGQSEGRVHVILTPQERAMYLQRAEVVTDYEPVLDKKGNQMKSKDGKPMNRLVVKSVGAPLTLLAIASKIEQRSVDRKNKVAAVVEKFRGKFHYPESANVTAVHWTRSKDEPGRLVMTGKVNGVEVKPVMLSEEASFGISNKIITNEEAFMENKELRSQLLKINASNYRSAAEGNAIDALVARVTDPAAKSFTAEQVAAINAAIGRSEDRGAAIRSLWEKAEPQMLEKGADRSWFEGAQQELNAVAAKTWEQKPEGVSVGR